MSLVGLFISVLKELDGVVLSAAWQSLTLVHPTASVTNSDRVLSWTKGGARNISVDSGGIPIQYRINSGTWTTYSAPFSFTSGGTLGFRYLAQGVDDAANVVVTDVSRGATIDQFLLQELGNP